MVPMPKMIGAAANMWCIQVMAPTAMMKAEIAPTIGHGLGIDEVVVVVLDLRRSHCGLSVSGAVRLRHVFVSKIKCRRLDSCRSGDQRLPLRLSGSLAASGFGAGSRTG